MFVGFQYPAFQGYYSAAAPDTHDGFIDGHHVRKFYDRQRAKALVEKYKKVVPVDVQESTAQIEEVIEELAESPKEVEMLPVLYMADNTLFIAAMERLESMIRQYEEDSNLLIYLAILN